MRRHAMCANGPPRSTSDGSDDEFLSLVSTKCPIYSYNEPKLVLHELSLLHI